MRSATAVENTGVFPCAARIAARAPDRRVPRVRRRDRITEGGRVHVPHRRWRHDGDGACKGIREHDENRSIGLFTEEAHEPKARPPLTKGLWKGKDENRLAERKISLSTSTQGGRSSRSISTHTRQPGTTRESHPQ